MTAFIDPMQAAIAKRNAACLSRVTAESLIKRIVDAGRQIYAMHEIYNKHGRELTEAEQAKIAHLDAEAVCCTLELDAQIKRALGVSLSDIERLI